MKKLKKLKPHSAKSLKPLKKLSSAPAKVLLPQEGNISASVLPEGTAEFEKAIAESKLKLELEMAPKRGRGRPKKIMAPLGSIQSHEGESSTEGAQVPEANTRADAAAFPSGTTTLLWKIGAGFAADYTGDSEWRCDDSQCDALDQATVPVLNRYLPPGLVEASPLATLAITAASVFGMKYLSISKRKKEEAEAKRQTVVEENQPRPISTTPLAWPSQTQTQ